MLYSKFRNFIKSHALIEKGDGIVVAVSGGVDSMVLLDLCHHLAKQWDLNVSVAHVNHRLRGKESDADESLVRMAAKRYGIPCDALRRKPAKRQNLQDAARESRIEFFKKVAAKRGARTIATAHHQDDQAETVLMHLIRGAGTKGLSGMRPSSEIGRLRLIRPLLSASRAEIERHAREHRILFLDDATNAAAAYRRNSIRHNLMPILREFNPQIASHLARLAERLAEDEESFSALARAALDESLLLSDNGSVAVGRRAYMALPPALRKRVLRQAFTRASGSAKDLNSDQLLRMDGIALGASREGSYRLPAPWKFFRDGDIISIRKSSTKCDRN